MCGIFAVVNDKNHQAVKTIFKGLKTLEYRGYDSWGIVAHLENDRLIIKKEIGKLPNKLNLKINLLKSNTGIGHTRWATHGGITKENAHPHFDCQKKIFVVHNGIIENFLDLKQSLIRKNHHLFSQTDTEVVAHLLEEEMNKVKNYSLTDQKKLIPQIIFNVFNKIKGLNAFIFYFSQLNLLAAIKNSSPIVFGENKKQKEFFLASDYVGIINHTNRVYFLNDNELLIVTPNNYQLYNAKKELVNKINFISIKNKRDEISLKNYPHYMIKEIKEQPLLLENIVNNQKEEIKKLAKIVRQSYGNFLIGCGTSYYAALCGTYLFAKIANRHTNASIGSEFSYLVNFLKPTSLVIALSQSGETIDVIASVNKTKEKGAKIFAITNVLGSTLYRLADFKILLNAGVEKAVVATKSFTAKLAILILLSFALNNNHENGIYWLKKSINELKQILKNEERIKGLAKILKNKEHIYILGRGLSYPLALEAALKIKEVSYIHAEGFAAGELKHGVIALIEKNTPVIIFNPEDETYNDTLSSAYEIKARGAYIIGVSSRKDPVYDIFFPVKNCNVANLIPYVGLAQLLGYYLAIEKNLDPDKPRNLAKSVTVK
jgi:glucosamine--fructose-6-phosphate aminotransferase (isomerizing)